MRTLVIAALCGSTACAGARDAATPRLAPAPVSRPPASRAPAPRPPSLELAVELDLEVIQFAALRRQLTIELDRERAGGTFWPEKIRALWSRLIVSLQDALDRPPGDYPKPLLIRTRVAIDTELDRTRERFGPTPENIDDGFRRVAALLTTHVRARESPSDDVRAPDIVFDWPLVPLLITSPFGTRSDPMADEGSQRMHAGVDLGGTTGDLVTAAAAGRVAYVGWLENAGNTVVLRHPGGWVTIYAHLHDVDVRAGARVAKGYTIGFVGSTGRATGPHLHFEIRRGGVPVDPETVVRKRATPAS